MSKETLIIDDDKIICFLHKKLCERNGIESALIFTEAQEAVNYLKDSDTPGREVLLLLDINMPVMNGWDVLDALKKVELKSRVDVIMVTSSIDDADLTRSKDYEHVRGFVSKPLDLEKLQSISQRDTFLTLL